MVIVAGGIASALTPWNALLIAAHPMFSIEGKRMPPWFGKPHSTDRTPSITAYLYRVGCGDTL